MYTVFRRVAQVEMNCTSCAAFLSPTVQNPGGWGGSWSAILQATSTSTKLRGYTQAAVAHRISIIISKLAAGADQGATGSARGERECILYVQPYMPDYISLVLAQNHHWTFFRCQQKCWGGSEDTHW